MEAKLKDSIFHHVQAKYDKDDNLSYVLLKELKYYSKRYDKWITCPTGMASDGATGAMDIVSYSWFFHDKLCDTGLFDDGTKCNNWQASRILSDILKEEGHTFRSHTWLWATWLFGGGEARKNGMR